VTVQPQTSVLKLDGREAGRTVTRWMLNQAARGPATVNGAGLSF
jgi:hypothetical protein